MMVIDFWPLSLKVTEEITHLTYLKYFHLRYTEKLCIYQIKGFGCIL